MQKVAASKYVTKDYAARLGIVRKKLSKGGFLYSGRSVAKKLKVSVQFLLDMEKGNRNMSLELAERYERIIGKV